MSIALVGVPKTGKTKFSKTLGIARLDNIPQRFSKRTGVLIGPHADFRVNFVLAGLRFQEEYAHQSDPFVATTTVLDSIAYSSLGIYKNELNLGGPIEDMISSPYYFTTIYLLKYFDRGWNFDKTFYLPYTGKDEDLVELDKIYITILETKVISYETVD